MDAILIDKLFAFVRLPGDPSAPETAETSMMSAFRKAWATEPDEVGTQVLRYRSDFAVLFTGPTGQVRAAKLRWLVNQFVKNADLGASVAQRAMRLSRWCRLFGAVDPTNTKQFARIKVVTEMIDEIFDSGQAVSKAFTTYCETTPTAADYVYRMREAMESAGKGKATVYNVIHFMHQNGLDASTLTPENVVNLFKMALKAPPYTAFTGYADWGKGNHADVAENKKMHFCKHVLDAHPEDSQKLTWHGECALWWQKLGIKLTRAQVQGLLGVGVFAQVKVHLPAGDGDTLAFDKVPALVEAVRKAGGWGQPTLNQLYATYGAVYVDAALAMSRAMQHVIVHGDPSKPYAVFLKGINGDYFIGGRIEGDDLTISTCFAPRPDVDKVALNEDRKIWAVKQG